MRKKSTEARHSPCFPPSTAPLASPCHMPQCVVSPQLLSKPSRLQGREINSTKGEEETGQAQRAASSPKVEGKEDKLEGRAPPANFKRREKEGRKGNAALPFSWEPRKMLCSTTGNVPQIFHISTSLSLALGIRMDHTQRKGGRL